MVPEKQELAVKPSGDGLMAVIERALHTPDMDVAKLQELLNVKERWDAIEARKAFVVAMNAFKAHPLTITKNKQVNFGNTHYSHATLDHVVDVVTGGLGQHGISHRWSVEQGDGNIKVTCILTHELGHSESTTLSATADTSGSKNAIQAIGSTVTYLQRYTLLAATGLAAANTDDDAQSGASGDGKYEDLAERLEWIENASTMEELLKIYKTAYKEANALNDQAAQKQLIAAKDRKKKELS